MGLVHLRMSLIIKYYGAFRDFWDESKSSPVYWNKIRISINKKWQSIRPNYCRQKLTHLFVYAQSVQNLTVFGKRSGLERENQNVQSFWKPFSTKVPWLSVVLSSCFHRTEPWCFWRGVFALIGFSSESVIFLVCRDLTHHYLFW